MRRLIVLALALVVTPTAGAATLSLTVPTGSTVFVAPVTLSGVDQITTFSIGIDVVYTGSGNTTGWKVTASSTTLTSGTNTLPGIVITGVTRGTCSGTSCINPSNSVTWPFTLSTTATRIYNAAVNTGTGTVGLTSTYKINYPANALPGSYTSTVTVATTTGP